MFDFVPSPTSPEAYPYARINPFLKLAITIVGMLVVLFVIFALMPVPSLDLEVRNCGFRP